MSPDLTQLIALAAALGWASGLRLYAVVFLTGAAGFMGWVPLPAGLQVLQNPAVLVGSFMLFAMEFVADKIPGIDTLWDAVHTFIRIPAGAALAFGALNGALGMDGNTWALLAALAGGTLAATAHTAKATTRAAVNTSPEPFSNIGLSLLGDAAVPTMLWLAYAHPLWFFPVLLVAVVLAVVLGCSFLLFVMEFVADKIPGVDTLWDAVHTFIRIPAGAALAFGALNGAFGVDGNTWAVLAALLGGTLAATAHTAKATTRAAVNTSPEPFSNIGLSLLGDMAVPAILWLAYMHPLWFFPALAVAVLLAVVLTVVLFKFLRALWRRFVPAATAAA